MKTRGKLVTGGIVLVAVAAALGLYLTGNSGAREKPAGRAPAAIPVAVSAAVQQSTPVKLQAIGNVEAFSTVALKARVDGQIVAVNFTEGRAVKKGEVLFRIDPRPFQAALRQAEANALRDSAARDQARSQAKRYQELMDKNFVSKEAYAQIATNAQVAEANAKASQAALENAQINLAYCTIVSPIDGYPGKVLLQVGNLVKANDVNSLVVINQVQPVYVSFAVPEQQLAIVRKHMTKEPLAVDATAGSDAAIGEGRLAFVDNAVDPSTGTIRMRAQFENRDSALWPGQFVTVSVRLFDQADAILIPLRALQTGPEGTFVYVVKADMTAELRKIVVERNEGERAVVKGLKVGERVVTRGALRLAPGARVEIRAEAEAQS